MNAYQRQLVNAQYKAQQKSHSVLSVAEAYIRSAKGLGFTDTVHIDNKEEPTNTVYLLGINFGKANLIIDEPRVYMHNTQAGGLLHIPQNPTHVAQTNIMNSTLDSLHTKNVAYVYAKGNSGPMETFCQNARNIELYDNREQQRLFFPDGDFEKLGSLSVIDVPLEDTTQMRVIPILPKTIYASCVATNGLVFFNEGKKYPSYEAMLAAYQDNIDFGRTRAKTLKHAAHHQVKMLDALQALKL